MPAVQRLVGIAAAAVGCQGLIVSAVDGSCLISAWVQADGGDRRAGTAATALERQATANAATAALDEVRERQMEVAKLVPGAMCGGEGSDDLLSVACSVQGCGKLIGGRSAPHPLQTSFSDGSMAGVGAQ